MKEHNLDLKSIKKANKYIKTMEDYEVGRYEAVGRCETFKELAKVIRSFANEDGDIIGRTRRFVAENMATFCEGQEERWEPRALTRNWGIRQQAYYIKFA